MKLKNNGPRCRLRSRRRSARRRRRLPAITAAAAAPRQTRGLAAMPRRPLPPVRPVAATGDAARWPRRSPAPSLEIKCRIGDRSKPNDVLLVIEAMKMKTSIAAPHRRPRSSRSWSRPATTSRKTRSSSIRLRTVDMDDTWHALNFLAAGAFWSISPGATSPCSSSGCSSSTSRIAQGLRAAAADADRLRHPGRQHSLSPPAMGIGIYEAGKRLSISSTRA